MEQIQPVAQLRRRPPEQGRIRIGAKTRSSSGKEIPTSIDTFRFTSADRTAIEQLAARYGGTAEPWNDPHHPGQWQVTTLVNELPIVLPPNCLSEPVYELWSKGGLQRRCDGVTCQVPTIDGDSVIYQEHLCLCQQELAKAEGHRVQTCSRKTRITVIVKGVRFGGGWLLTTGGTNAAAELPGMVELIEAMQHQGLTNAVLRLERRSETRAGKRRDFVVPVLSLDLPVEEVVAGKASLAHGSLVAIEGGNPLAAIEEPDEPAEGIILISDQDLDGLNLLAEQVAKQWSTEHPTQAVTGARLLQILASMVSKVDIQSAADLAAGHGEQIASLLEEILDGTVRLSAVTRDRVKVQRQS